MTKHFRFGAIAPDLLDFTALQSMADDDPVGLLDRCRNRHRAIRKGIRALNWELWTACYAGGLSIRNHPERFEGLRKHEFFEQRTYKADIGDVLRLALLIGTDADTSGPAYKKACYIASRLQPFFDQDAEPEAVLECIEVAGGLKRLYGEDEAVEEDHTKPSDDGRLIDDVEPAGTAMNAPLKGARSNRPSPPAQPGRRLAPQRGRARGAVVEPNDERNFVSDDFDALSSGSDDEIILEVVVTEEILHELLNSSLGSRTRLIVEHTSTHAAWQRFEATSATVID